MVWQGEDGGGGDGGGEEESAEWDAQLDVLNLIPHLMLYDSSKAYPTAALRETRLLHHDACARLLVPWLVVECRSPCKLYNL